MIFTVLDDGNASLICNDCITEEQLDQGYSETELGCCDECGTFGKRLWPSQPGVGLVIGLTMMYVEGWGRERGLEGQDRVRMLATDADTDTVMRALEGLRIEPELIALLPGADRGRSWYEVERRLAGVTDGLLHGGSITAAMLASQSISSNHMHFNVQATNNMNFKQYQNMLFAAQIAKPKSIVKLVNP